MVTSHLPSAKLVITDSIGEHDGRAWYVALIIEDSILITLFTTISVLSAVKILLVTAAMSCLSFVWTALYMYKYRITMTND